MGQACGFDIHFLLLDQDYLTSNNLLTNVLLSIITTQLLSHNNMRSHSLRVWQAISNKIIQRYKKNNNNNKLKKNDNELPVVRNKH